MPLVLVAKTEGTQRIMAVDQTAQSRGLETGMALAQARAMVPGLRALPHDPGEDSRLLERIADWADRYTPLVGRDPPDGLLLDITGAAHLLGGERALGLDLVARFARQGLTARVAIAPTVGAAWALARFALPPADCAADPAARSMVHAFGVVLPEDMTRAGLDAVLARLPIAALRLPPATTAALGRVGLKRIGDVMGRPRSALAARFGAALIVRLDQARGIDTEAISPRQPIPPARVEHICAEPMLTTAAVERTCGALAVQLAGLLEARGQGATALQLAVHRVDGLVKRIDLRLASPCKDAATLTSLMALRLGHLDDPLDPGFGYDLIRLAATAVAARGAAARTLTGLLTDLTGASDLADPNLGPLRLAEACAPLIDRLAARFGAGAIHTIAMADTHIPEQSARFVPSSQTPASQTPAKPARGSDPLVHDPRQRPLRLFDPPEPVDVMAEVPDGPPIHLRWRRRPCRIVAVHGPERIAPEWWRPSKASEDAGLLDDATRDYWRIEDASGRRLWLYREGIYGSNAGQTAARPPRWYVHGLFA